VPYFRSLQEELECIRDYSDELIVVEYFKESESQIIEVD
jgi:hypothetical protein